MLVWMWELGSVQLCHQLKLMGIGCCLGSYFGSLKIGTATPWIKWGVIGGLNQYETLYVLWTSQTDETIPKKVLITTHNCKLESSCFDHASSTTYVHRTYMADDKNWLNLVQLKLQNHLSVCLYVCTYISRYVHACCMATRMTAGMTIYIRCNLCSICNTADHKNGNT